MELDDTKWIEESLDEILDVFPSQWTPIRVLDMAKIGSRLKQIGFVWSTCNELNRVMFWLETAGILLRDEHNGLVKRGDREFVLNHFCHTIH